MNRTVRCLGRISLEASSPAQWHANWANSDHVVFGFIFFFFFFFSYHLLWFLSLPLERETPIHKILCDRGMSRQVSRTVVLSAANFNKVVEMDFPDFLEFEGAEWRLVFMSRRQVLWIH